MVYSSFFPAQSSILVSLGSLDEDIRAGGMRTIDARQCGTYHKPFLHVRLHKSPEKQPRSSKYENENHGFIL